MIRPRLRSYGDNSTVTLSPASTRIRNRRIFPAIDIDRSSTRREELLLGPDITQRVWLLRRMYNTMTADPPQGAGMDMGTAMEALLQRMSKTDTNIEFLESLKDEG